MFKAVFYGLVELLKDLINLASLIKEPQKILLLMLLIAEVCFISSMAVSAIWEKLVWVLDTLI